MAARKQEEPTADLDVQMATGHVVARKGDAGLQAYLMTEVPDADESADASYKAIIAQIMSANSAFDVLTPPEINKARDCINRPFSYYGFHLNQSEYDAGSPYYATMDVIFDGETKRAVINCGHQALMAQLIKLEDFRDEFPFHVIIGEVGRPNAFGNTHLRLIMVEDENDPTR